MHFSTGAYYCLGAPTMESKFIHAALAGVVLAIAAASALSISPVPDTREIQLPSFFVSSNFSDVRFFLFPDPANPNSSDEIIYGDNATLGRYDPSKPTKFLTHGFLSNGLNTDGFPGNVKDAYLARDADHSYNVITVDWGKLATPEAGLISGVFYTSAVGNVKLVGKTIGHFISWLHNESMIDIESTHLIGHSLGSHVSGKAGHTVTELTGKTVGRITALDPAGPLFNTEISARSIKTFDAQFIDVYHTNAAVLGKVQRVGSIDFFVNGGGAPQPGCFPLDFACCHSRSHEYFAQTILEGDPAINPNNATQCVCVSKLKFSMNSKCCDTKLLFGEFSRPGKAGKYYVHYELHEDAQDS